MSYRLESPNGDVIEFDQVSYTILRDNLSGFAAYPVDYEITEPPGFIGAVVNSAVINTRTISLDVLVMGAGRAALEDNRLRLINALNPLNGRCRFVWTAEDQQEYYLDVTPADGSPDFSVGTAHEATMWQCSIDLIAHNPCWMSMDEVEIEIIGERGRFILPFDPVKYRIGDDESKTTITNPGTVDSPVVITLTGALYSPIVLTNTTVNQTMTVRQDIEYDETLVIDTSDDNLSVTLIDGSGERTDALHRCAIGSKFWQLRPGDNIIEYSVGSKGDSPRGVLAYRPRWLSR